MGSFTRHKLIDYCIDASEMKSREKTPRSVPRRCAAAALPLFCQNSRSRVLDGAPYCNSDVGWTLVMELH